MRRSFDRKVQSNPLPPLTATDTETKARLLCLPSCCMVHCFNDLRMLMLLGLCKCMKVRALLGLRLLCAVFTSTHLVSTALHPSPFACISPAFHPTQANFFTLFFSLLLQVPLLRIDSLSLAMLLT